MASDDAAMTNGSIDLNGNAEVYYWDDEVDESGPKHPELEIACQGIIGSYGIDLI